MYQYIDVDTHFIQVINNLRKKYKSERYIFVEGNLIKLLLHRLGVSNTDIAELQHLANRLKKDPTLSFRKSQNARYKCNYNNNKIHRLVDQPFILTKDEGFDREDSGVLRNFEPVEKDIQQNPAFNKLLLVHFLLIEGIKVLPRQCLTSNDSQIFSTVFFLRTITTKDLLGEPAREGVHSDGVEHTMTVFLNSYNMDGNSGVAKIHSIDEENGLRWDCVNEKFVIDRVHQKSILDTLLIVDSELKHSISPVFQESNHLSCYRDMLIFFSRKKKSKQHSSYIYDRDKPNSQLPLTLAFGFKEPLV